jgi:acetyltransferase-like isoleucine patch superfamily enzyme
MESLDKKTSILIGLLSWMPSKLKVAAYRILGARIGRGVRMGMGSVIVARDFKRIKIGDYSTISSFSVIACDEIELGEDCSIGPFVWIYGGSLLWMVPRESKLKIGDVTYIGARSIINATRDVSIGDFTGIGGGTTIYTHGFQSSYIDGQPRKEEPVSIGNNVWIQPKSTILPGVTVGDNSIVGSGSVVTKDIPSDVFAVGCPCSPKSDVGALKKSSSTADREQRTKQVIKDYFDSLIFLNEGGVSVKEIEKDHWLLTVKRFFGILKTSFRILYVQNVDDDTVNKVNRFKGNILLISLSGIEEKSRKALGENILWIDLSRKSIRNREHLPPRFYSFIRDYYGEGLRVYKSP